MSDSLPSTDLQQPEPEPARPSLPFVREVELVKPELPAGAHQITALRTRLTKELMGRSARGGLWSWLGPLLVTALAAILRLWSLGSPKTLIFDETYYVKDAYSLLTQGYEGVWLKDINPQFAAGDFSGLTADPELFVHPQVGKWMIALGQMIFGPENPFGWRFIGAICGTLAVWMIARIARRIFGSNLLGTLAGLLMAVDGASIVMSRTGILDVFVMFFALCAFGALLMDRYQFRRRLIEKTLAEAASPVPKGPLVAGWWPSSKLTGWWPSTGFRWWRIAAGVSFGLCIGVKWSGMYFLAVFAVMSVLWDVSARRIVADEPLTLWQMLWKGSLSFVRAGIPAFCSTVVVGGVTYVASWWSWFVHPQSYGRLMEPGQATVGFLGEQRDAIFSLFKFHEQMWNFHTSLGSHHDYMSKPWGWILQWRPTSFYYETPSDCGAKYCSQAITSIGNPIIWWGAAVALVAVVIFWSWGRDWRAGAALSGLVAGWLPWFLYGDRTIYTFYTIAFEPWVILVAVFGIGLILGRPDAPASRRRKGAWVAGSLVMLAVAAAGFWWPIWSAETITYDFWRLHMWLPSWI